MTYCTLRCLSVGSTSISIMTENLSCASLDVLAVDSFPQAIQDVAKENGFTTVLWFSRLCVKPQHQSHGEGTFLMNIIAEHCDLNKLWIVNGPNAYKREDQDRLDVFYKRFGFEFVSDDTDEYLMLRPPLVVEHTS